MNSKQMGLFGEKIARDYLEKKGYKILDQNYSRKQSSGPIKGEIDIVAKRRDVIAFVEVKALTGNNQPISPEEKVNFPKQRKIIKTAQSWLIEKRIPLGSKWQIDIISIKIDLESKKAKIRHFENCVS